MEGPRNLTLQIIIGGLQVERMVKTTVEVLTDTEELWELQNGFRHEIGEDLLSEKQRENLRKSIEQKRIVFFIAKRSDRPVGICSVAPCYSTFSCSENGVFDDFYVEPDFRKQGIARRLILAAQEWCKTQGYASLTVGCADCDIGMYSALGFKMRLGTMLAADLRLNKH